MDALKGVKVFETPELVSEAAANFIVDLSKNAISKRGRFVISLSGGHTPEKLYALLATAPFNIQIDWQNTFIFWGDERCVPMKDERNNAFMAQKILLDKVAIPAGNINPMPVNLQLPFEAAEAYEEILFKFFGETPPDFDLVLLGLGENGHTASLFPGTAVLKEGKRWVKDVFVQEQEMFRITLTAPLINQALNVMFLVTGKEKASILKTVLDDSYQPEKYPAQLIKPVTGNLFWFVDRAASPEVA